MPSFRTPLNRTRALEWLFATLLAVWGWALLAPGVTYFDLPVYTLMRQWAPEEAWGLAALAVSILRLFGLYINGWWKRTPIIRCACSIISGMFWLSIMGLMYLGAKVSGIALTPGYLYYGVFFVFEGWCVLSTGYDIQQEGAFGTRAPSRYVARGS